MSTTSIYSYNIAQIIALQKLASALARFNIMPQESYRIYWLAEDELGFHYDQMYSDDQMEQDLKHDRYGS